MKHKPAKKRKQTAAVGLNKFQSNIWKIRLKEIMKAQKLSQRALANSAGLGSTSIRHLVNKADTVTLTTLQRIADATGVPLSLFVTGNSTVVKDLTDPDFTAQRSAFVIPVHGPRDDRSKDNKRGYVLMSETKAGAAPFALKMGDGSMVGTGSNAPVDPLQVVGPNDVVTYDACAIPSVGELFVLNISDNDTPHWVVRILEEDDGAYYAAALSRSFGRRKISEEHVSCRFTSIIREAPA